MDVDTPVGLKRSTSAPMINELNTTMTTASTSTSTRDSLPFSNHFSPSQTRTRRFSASSSFSPVQTTPGPRLTPRVNQLRQEECVDQVLGRETAHERELHSAMQMSQSWEDLTLVPGSPSSAKSEQDSTKSLTQNILPPLHVNLPSCPPMCSSPSPTRVGIGRQWTPGIWKLSPSPTRKFQRRSQSPIAVRPSSFGQVKRKCEMEEDKIDHYPTPPAKRLNSFSADRGGLLMTHSNRLEAVPSPLPGSLSSGDTPESLSSADSPGFTFIPVDSPSPGPSMMAITDEPMNEERSHDLLKQDHVMTSVEESPS